MSGRDKLEISVFTLAHRTTLGRCNNKKCDQQNVIYGTLSYSLQAIRCCASNILLNRLGLGNNSEFYAIYTRIRYILLRRLGLGINFIQWIPLRSYNDTQFVAVALFVVTPG